MEQLPKFKVDDLVKHDNEVGKVIEVIITKPDYQGNVHYLYNLELQNHYIKKYCMEQFVEKVK